MTLVLGSHKERPPVALDVDVEVTPASDKTLKQWLKDIGVAGGVSFAEDIDDVELVPVDTGVPLALESSLWATIVSEHSGKVVFYVRQGNEPEDALRQVVQWIRIRPLWGSLGTALRVSSVLEHTWRSRLWCCGRLWVKALLGASDKCFVLHVRSTSLEVAGGWGGLVAKVALPPPEERKLSEDELSSAAPMSESLLVHEAGILRKLAAANVPGVPALVCLAQWQSTRLLLTIGVGVAATAMLAPSCSGGLSWDTIQDIARQVSATLVAMHSAGLVHMDVSPGNIVHFAKSQRWGLVDFASTCVRGSVVSADTGVTDEFASDRVRWRGIAPVTADPMDDFTALGWSLAYLHRPLQWGSIRRGQRPQFVQDIEDLLQAERSARCSGQEDSGGAPAKRKKVQ